MLVCSMISRYAGSLHYKCTEFVSLPLSTILPGKLLACHRYFGGLVKATCSDGDGPQGC